MLQKQKTLFDEHKAFKKYDDHSKSQMEVPQFLDAVNSIPYFKPYENSSGEYMSNNVLANCMHECNLSIRDLVT